MAITLLAELLIVKGTLLRIDERVISQRHHRKLAGRFLRAAVNVRMVFARKFAIGGFDLTRGRRLFNAQDLVVIGHLPGVVRPR